MTRCFLSYILLFFWMSSAGIGCEKTSDDAKKEEQLLETPTRTNQVSPLLDGAYLVQRRSPNQQELMPLEHGEVVLEFKADFGSKADENPSEFLAVLPHPDVPLELKEKPQIVGEGSESPVIQLILTDAAAKKLEEFTSANQGGDRRVVVVIDSQAVTMHKIRSAISEGKLQISCCAEGACKHLAEKLRDNVAHLSKS